MADNEQVSAAAMTTKPRKKADRAVAKAQAKAERAAEKVKAKAEKERVKSLAKMAEDKVIKELIASLEVHARSATFACGGVVPIKQKPTHSAAPTTDTDTQAAKGNAIDPVQIRFGTSGSGVTVTFAHAEATSPELQALIQACVPASFGRGGEEVLDGDYRKAVKLDKTAFATSFCPYEAGIIDVISQLLAPQTVHDKHMCSIKAELYKLNVYSAPSGKFKAHVDTPRSKDQIGSLVIALPVAHEGGELGVRSAGKEVLFDWSAGEGCDDDRCTIKWAAFYSDCEHEVYEVTSGRRVTLTYNLYLTRGLGRLAGSTPGLQPEQLPLYASLEGALDSPGFMRNGRVLALWLTHSYAHTNKHVNFLPGSLKGADMSLYNTAQALGLKCLVVPIMTLEYGGYHDDRPCYLLHRNFKFQRGVWR
ncbi:hypothetical protein LTR37_002064 [Vermiconidia calcicola]|uniref:Uncharacterized protein n=1 Tax=Vermiconidia calcicola TaxID=1690605 RepID=A0ACC3NTJ8_9PEZI|nr:hypothetical protein LTR37_002064 [Vermiconidia calcicola]